LVGTVADSVETLAGLLGTPAISPGTLAIFLETLAGFVERSRNRSEIRFSGTVI
jgi:hypothetical protein